MQERPPAHGRGAASSPPEPEILPGAPGVEVVRGAVLAPVVPVAGGPPGSLPFLLGGWGPDGSPIGAMRFRRGPLEAPAPPRPAGRVRRLAGRHAYGGLLFGQFGHFLTESLARAWYLRAHPELPVLWHLRAGRTALAAWQRDILAMLGLPEQPLGVTEPLEVEELVVPAPGFVLRRTIHRAQAEALGVHGGACAAGSPPVWLSRSRLGEGPASFEGEERVEAVLRDAGWAVLHPETMPVAAQLSAICGAPVVAGIEGSALHGVLLCREFRGEIRIVPRDGARPGGNFGMIAAAKGIRQVAVPAPMRQLTQAARRSRFAIEAPEALAAALLAAGGA